MLDSLENERVRISMLREERDSLQMEVELQREALEQEKAERARLARANLRKYF